MHTRDFLYGLCARNSDLQDVAVPGSRLESNIEQVMILWNQWPVVSYAQEKGYTSLDRTAVGADGEA